MMPRSKYIDNQTSRPARQALSGGESACLVHWFVGDGEPSILIQRLPTCSFRCQLTAYAHDLADGY